LSLSPKTIIKDMGYAKRSKVHAQKHDEKEEERKDAYPKAVCHMLISERCIPKEGLRRNMG
jgi:hypothetical protein